MHKFGDTKHWVPTNQEGKYDSKKYEDIQSEYAGNLTKFKFLEARVYKYDIKSMFVIPTFCLVNENATVVEHCWSYPATTGVKLFNHCTKIALHQDFPFHKDTYYDLRNIKYIVSLKWLKQIVARYFAVEAIKRVEGKYYKL